MVKVSSSDILAILRRFDHALEDTTPRHVEHVKYSHPNPANTLVAFRYQKQQFYILFDDAAEDDTQYILEQVRTDKQDVTGEVLENPNDHMTTYALPFKGKEVYLFLVTTDKQRLDLMLAARYPKYSRSTWQKYIKAGHVKVNGTTKMSAKYEVSDADDFAVTIPEDIDYSQDELPILYIDDNVIVINKPVGVLTHDKGALNDEFTVASFFRRYTTNGLDTNRPGIVHRLDRDTSGVMIGARHDEAATLLKKQFADRKAKKTYIAVLEGIPKQEKARIELPIGRNPAAPATFRVATGGKTAITNYEILASHEGRSLVELTPLTGRTHQLRVHMQYIGAPILGDRVYGKPAERLFLHAKQLEITIPGGERQIFTAPVPDEFFALFPGIHT